MSSTFDIGKKLVDLVKAGKSMEAVESLYSKDIVSIEAVGMGGKSPRSDGIEKIREKHVWWESNHEVHKAEVSGPWPNGDKFIVRYTYEVTVKAGPMAGKRITMDEAALYTVKDGKVVHEEFFYHM